MAKAYRTSNRPMVASNTLGIVSERGKRSRQDVQEMIDRRRADTIHKSRSNGQRVRQARERLYGKNSHLVVVTRIGV
jgi:hypothetical protein